MALERLELLITSTGAAAAKEIKAVGTAAEEAGTKTTLFQKASTGAKTAISQLSGGLIPVESGFKAAGVAAAGLAGVGLVKFALDSASEFANLAGEVRTFQRASGATAEESSRFVAVLDDMEISTDKGAKAIFKMGRELGQGGDALSKFGVETAKNNDGTTNLTETLLNVADAYTNIRDPAERAALVQAAFGRAGAELVPILEKGRKGLKEFFDQSEEQHQLFTQEDLDQARKYELALDHLSDTLRGFKLEVGKFALPLITTAAEQGATTLDALDSSLGAVGLSFGDVGSAVGNTLGSFNAISNATHAWAAGSELLAGNFGDAALEFGKSIPVVNQVVGLFDSGDEASNKFADAQTKLKDAQATAASLAAEGKTNTQEYRDAMADARDASDTLYGAQKDLADSMTDVAVKTQQATDAMLIQIGASLSLQGSFLGVLDALDKKKEAEDDAAAAAVFGIDKSREVAEANLKVQQSILQVIDVAGKKAIADAGPNASAAEQARAKTKAQADAVAYLRDTVPGASEQLDILGIKVRDLPNGKHVIVTAETGQAVGEINYLNTLVQRLVGGQIRIGVSTGPRLQSGGHVSRGRSYLVGEAGPEMFVPSTSGTIVPNHELGGGGMAVTVNVGGSVITERELVDSIHRGLLEKQRAGTLGLS